MSGATLRKQSVFDSLCKEHKIKRCFTSAYTPSENGRAERANRTLCDTMRCNLIDAHLGWNFWSYAYMSGVVSRNRIPGSRGSLSKFEKFYGRHPNWARLVPFGSSAHISMPHCKQDLDRGEPVRMVGYPLDAKGWIFINADGKIRVSRHARFDLREVRDRQPAFQPGVEATLLPGFPVGLTDRALREKVSKFEDDVIRWSDPTPASDKLLDSKRGFVGRLVHRNFKGVIHRGKVTEYLPPVANDDVDLWHVVHDDGDSEDLNESELAYALDLYESSLKPPPAPPVSVPPMAPKPVSPPPSPTSIMDFDGVTTPVQRKRTGPSFDDLSDADPTCVSDLDRIFAPSFNKRGRIMTDDEARDVIEHSRSQGMHIVFNPEHKKIGKSKKRYEFYKNSHTFDDIEAAVLTPNMKTDDLMHDTARGICKFYTPEDPNCPPTVQLADSSQREYFEFCNAHLTSPQPNVIQRLYELHTAHQFNDNMINEESWHHKLVQLAHVACVSGESKPEYTRALDAFALQTINEVVCG